MICLEGINGAGKTSVADELQVAMTRGGLSAKVLHDPGSTPIGERIRALVKDPAVPMAPMVQMLLYTTARVALAEEVKKLIRAGTWVIMDRWWPSTYAYQGALGVPVHLILELNYMLMPKEALTTKWLTFFLDVPVDVAMERSGATKPKGIEGGGDRHETQGQKFWEDVAEAYGDLVDLNYMTRINVMGYGSPKDVATGIWWRIAGGESPQVDG